VLVAVSSARRRAARLPCLTGAEWEHVQLGDALKTEGEAQDAVARFCSISRGWADFGEI